MPLTEKRNLVKTKTAKKSIHSFLFLSMGMAICVVIGCSTNNPQQSAAPDFNIPENFKNSELSAQTIQSSWLKTFDDPHLHKLISEVLTNNLDLQIAAAKVDSAAAAAKQAGATLKPAVNLGLQGTDRGNVKGASGDGISNVGTSLDISWELDVWGRIRAGRDAATEELQASSLDYEYAKLSLAAQTAKAYFLAIETRRQVGLASDTVANYAKAVDIASAFFDEGLVGIQDVHLAKSQRASAEASLENLRAAYADALRSLEALLGRYPSADIEITNTLPTLPTTVPAGVPSDVLERRPDIVAAERRVAAAFKKTQQAKAAKLPTISLTSSAGGSGSSLSDIVDPANMIWNVATSLMFPIFDGGNLDAQIASATANQKQALANYQKTALSAFVDIESALSNETSLRKQIINLRSAYDEAARAEKIGWETYQGGEGNLLDVQQLQRSTISARSALLNTEHELFVQRINLYLGLGGEI